MTTTHKAIDLQLVQQYAGGDTDFAITLLETFAAEIPDIAAALQQALHQQDWKTLSFKLHYLTNSATFCGAVPLKQMTWSLEEDLIENAHPPLDVIQQQLQAIETELTRVQNAIASGIKK